MLEIYTLYTLYYAQIILKLQNLSFLIFEGHFVLVTVSGFNDVVLGEQRKRRFYFLNTGGGIQFFLKFGIIHNNELAKCVLVYMGNL